MIKPVKNKRRWKFLIAAAITGVVTVGVLSLQITTISVDGNTRYTDEQIINLLFHGKGARNSIYCMYREQFQEHEKIPFVEEYQVKFENLTTAEIIVYEKSVVGYVDYMGSYLYFDKDGIIVESTSEKLDDIPWVTGLKFGHIVLHKPLPVENAKIFGEILNLTQILSVYSMGVDKIQYDSHGSATLVMGDINVVLGDDGGVNGKIAELNDMLPKLEGLSGTLYLDTYDETNNNATYTFKKR